MPVFERQTAFGNDRIAFEAEHLIMAGWTGREPAAVQRHLDELRVLGVAPPSRVPLFYRMDPALLAGPVAAIAVLGEDTSGEVEAVLVALADGLWVGLGSDHTDRAMEAHGVAISKQLCRKPMAGELWRFDEVIEHWDQLVLRAHIVEHGERRLYMEDALAAVRRPEDLIAACTLELGLAKGVPLPVGTVLFMGAIGAMGGIRPAPRFEMALADPVLGRTLRHAYDVRTLADRAVSQVVTRHADQRDGARRAKRSWMVTGETAPPAPSPQPWRSAPPEGGAVVTPNRATAASGEATSSRRSKQPRYFW